LQFIAKIPVAWNTLKGIFQIADYSARVTRGAQVNAHKGVAIVLREAGSFLQVSCVVLFCAEGSGESTWDNCGGKDDWKSELHIVGVFVWLLLLLLSALLVGGVSNL